MLLSSLVVGIRKRDKEIPSLLYNVYSQGPLLRYKKPLLSVISNSSAALVQAQQKTVLLGFSSSSGTDSLHHYG